MGEHEANEFDAAKTIVEALRNLTVEQQRLALSFAAQSLGLDTVPELKEQAGSLREEQQISQTPQIAQRAWDIKTFCDHKDPRSDQQFAAVVAYFYRFEAPEAERRESISADTLSNAARLVGRKRPSRHALNNAKKAGYLDSAGHGDFQINTVGENLVAVTLPGGASDFASKPRRSNKKSSGQRKAKRRRARS